MDIKIINPKINAILLNASSSIYPKLRLFIILNVITEIAKGMKNSKIKVLTNLRHFNSRYPKKNV